MPATSFDLVTQWRLAAPLDRVWKLVVEVEEWPSWWPAVKRVELIEPGDADGIGAVRRLTWGTALPYSLTFDVRTVRVEPQRIVEGRAFGELDGTGLWTLSRDGSITVARYDWRVELTKPWMRTLAALLCPAFAWNHHKVMGWGEAGARKRLGC
jgi:hypothetical protein